MKSKKVYLRKSLAYRVAITLGCLTVVGGDRLLQGRMTPFVESAVEPTHTDASAGLSINPDDWESLAQAVSERAESFSGSAGYVIKDLKSGRIVRVHEDKAFPSASLIKLPILCAAFQAAEEGKLPLNATVTLQRADKRGGSGILKFSPPGSVFTNRELLEHMIIHSDNTAAELVIRQLGFDYLQATFARLGLKDTTIHPEGFRLTSRRVQEDNTTSPRDMALLLEEIYQHRLVSSKASREMLDILKHQKLRDRLPRFLPHGWEIAHKTGLLRRACHDVGIVFSPKGDYMVCVLTSHHNTTYKTAKRFIASVGRITYHYYQAS